MRNFFRRTLRRPARTTFIDPKHLESCTDDRPPAAPPPKTDWPEIQSRHPGWWQVHRVEVPDSSTERRFVLIAELRTEDEAFNVASQQASQVRITKWGDKQKPYFSMREPRMRITGTVTRAE